MNVSIARAKGCPVCITEFGKASSEPLKVPIEAAADYITRDPSDWVIADKNELALVQKEIKRRSDEEAAKAAQLAAGGGN